MRFVTRWGFYVNQGYKIFLSRLAIVFLSALFLAGCATQGMLKDNETAHVTKVVVSKSRSDLGSVNITEDVRVKTIREVRRYPASGRGKTVKILLTQIHFKNPLRSLLIGDSNFLTAVATVVDNQTNRVDGSFEIGARDRAVLNGVSGMLLAGLDSPVSTERRLAADLAEKIMVKIYGSARAQNIAARGPMPKAHYPASYKDLQKKYNCQKSQTAPDPNDVMAENKPPASCG